MPDIIIPEQSRDKIKRYRDQGLVRDDTLLTWLESNASEYASRPAIITSSTTLSYDELSKNVRSMATGLQSLGLGKGDVIAVQLPNIPEYIISYLAITTIGGIMQTLHMPYRQSELEYLLKDSRAAATICLSQFKDYEPASIFLNLMNCLKTSMHVISVGKPIDSIINYNELLSASPDYNKEDISTKDPFVLLYTSGTTSLPKGVPHRYNNFLTNARLCCEEYDFSNTDKLLSLAPMTHLYGLFAYNMSFAAAASAVLLPTFSPEEFIRTVRTLQPTAIFAAPAHFANCFHLDLLKQEDFESVEFVCLSGSAVQQELARQVDGLLQNGKVGQLWGMSELQAGAITRLQDSKNVRCGFSGRATPGTELRVVDNNDEVLIAGEEGELQVRGLSVFDGYLNKPEETKEAFSKDEWFRTGDTAILDSNENLKITGRTKNLINRGGVKYNPVEIEDIVSKLLQVVQCAIIPVPDQITGEKACAFIVAKNEGDVSLEDISSALNKAGVAKYKWPEQLVMIESMPMTPTNKVKLEELRQYLKLN
jgi:acyl-CoA synthetase (AMP-forming)/AMP-acid ligase II